MTDKRTRLLDAAIRLFHARGFWDTPTALIAREAGVANGTLFNNFPSKTELIDAVYLHLKAEWAGYMLAEPLETKSALVNMKSAWCRAVKWAASNPDRYALLMQMKLSEHVSEGTREGGMDLFEPAVALMAEARTDGGLAELPADFVQQLALAQMDAAIAWCIANPDTRPAEFAATSFDIFWRGIQAPAEGDIS